jgi:hypothetical protein
MKVISDGEYRKAKTAGAIKDAKPAVDQYLSTLRQIRDGITAIVDKPEKVPVDKGPQYVSVVLDALQRISDQLAPKPTPKRAWSFTVQRNKDGQIVAVKATQAE